MAVEIERKFLVTGDGWRSQAVGELYRQGYVVAERDRTVRVRVVGDRGYLTLKGDTQGIQRQEFEYPIPIADAEAMLLHLCHRPLIEKTRYKLAIGDVVWEIDEFTGDNAGLIVAEVELQDEAQALNLPDWIGAEVSHDPRYFNAHLIRYPFKDWGS